MRGSVALAGHAAAKPFSVPVLGALSARSNVIPGTTRPVDGDTCGIIPSKPLTSTIDVTAPITTKVTWTDATITGFVTFAAGSEGSVITNCKFVGADNSANKRQGVINAQFSGIAIEFIDCTIEPAILNAYINGFQGCGVRFTRCTFRYGVDNVRAQGDAGTLFLVACLGEKTNSMFPDLDHKVAAPFMGGAWANGGFTHNDGGQAFGALDMLGCDWTNNIWKSGEQYVNPCIMASQNATGDNGLRLVRLKFCWFDGGGATPPSSAAPMVQVLDSSRTALAPGAIVDITDNRFGANNPHSKGNGTLPVFAGNLNYDTTGSTTSWARNVWSSDGTAAQVNWNGSIVTTI